MAAVWVVRTRDESGYSPEGVFHELKEGRARIGWSSKDNQNLRLIWEAIQQGTPLNASQNKARSSETQHYEA